MNGEHQKCSPFFLFMSRIRTANSLFYAGFRGLDSNVFVFSE